MKKHARFPLTFALVGVLWAVLFFAVPEISLANASFYVDSTTGYTSFGNTTPQAQVDVSGAMYSRLVSASSTTINWDLGNVQQMTLSSSPTLAFVNGHSGGEYKFILRQDGTGGRVVTWPASVLWPNNTTPTFSTTASTTDIVSFLYDGTNYYGNASMGYVPSNGIARDGSFQWATTASASTLSFSYTVNTNGDLLLVAVHPDTTSDDVTGVTWNGNSMTRVAAVLTGCTGGTSATYLYKLENASAGTGNVVISVSPNRQIDGAAQAYSGVSSIDTSSSGCSNNPPAPSLTSTVSGDWYVGVVGVWNSYVSAISGASRLNASDQQAEMWDSNGSVGSAGSHTFTYSASNGANISHIDVLLKP